MILKLLSHLGLMMKLERDVQALVVDLVTGRAKLLDALNKKDLIAVVSDLKEVVDAGIIPMPGVAQATVDQVVADILAALEAPEQTVQTPAPPQPVQAV